MKKKGFTLIELLAVIVILAIIALIATPLVLKYIEKSRQESKVDSSYSFVRNLENEIANYSIQNKGKKFVTNKENIDDLGLNLIVKGENPDDGKVCLSNLGQVNKAMLKYGNYYVSYDGKKSSISDESTYSNFSCYLFSGDMGFTQHSSSNYYAVSNEINANLFNKFKAGYEYNVIIDDEIYTAFAVGADGTILMGIENIDEMLMVQVTETEILVASKFELTGNHKVKISDPIETPNNSIFSIEDGNILIADTEFTAGQASVLIEGEDGSVYLNENVELKTNQLNLYGIDATCRNNVNNLPELDNAIRQGKIVNITVIQNDNGKEIISKINTKNIIQLPYDNIYYIGRTVLMEDVGC